MLKISELNMGSIDSINYRNRKNKEYFNRIFYKDDYLDKVVRPDVYFLIGEKGTGKTAYATYLLNNHYNNTDYQKVDLNATEFEKFLKLSSDGSIKYSSMTEVWKTILLLLVNEGLVDRANFIEKAIGKVSRIDSAVKEYYKGAFRPEVSSAMKIVEGANAAAKVMAKHGAFKAEVAAELLKHVETEQVNIDISLSYLERGFRDSLSNLKLGKDFTLIIDGIDIRPQSVQFSEFVVCIKALAHAAWELNTDFFANIRDSKGRIKILLLMRPDIFEVTEFQNANAKIQDNSVVLNWQTSYSHYRDSSLFRLVDGMLGRQVGQPTLKPGEAWDHYFPYDVPHRVIAERTDNPFVGFLRYSFYRPRDIIQYLILMQRKVASSPDDAVFRGEIFRACQQEYSDYVLGEVKDYLSFYYPAGDFDEIVGFFNMLNGRKSFSWDVFKDAFEKYKLQLAESKFRELDGSPENFLQFLYQMNIIGYEEEAEDGSEHFVHWCFRDRTMTKLSPRIPVGLARPGAYRVHGGLVRALKLGSERA